MGLVKLEVPVVWKKAGKVIPSGFLWEALKQFVNIIYQVYAKLDKRWINKMIWIEQFMS